MKRTGEIRKAKEQQTKGWDGGLMQQGVFQIAVAYSGAGSFLA